MHARADHAGARCAVYLSGFGLSSSATLTRTWPSLAALIPSLNNTCVNAVDEDEQGRASRPCAPQELRTGVDCANAACGRPGTWPSAAPFFLPVDLHNASQVLSLGGGQPVAPAGNSTEGGNDLQQANLQVRTAEWQLAAGCWPSWVPLFQNAGVTREGEIDRRSASGAAHARRLAGS